MSTVARPFATLTEFSDAFRGTYVRNPAFRSAGVGPLRSASIASVAVAPGRSTGASCSPFRSQTLSVPCPDAGAATRSSTASGAATREAMRGREIVTSSVKRAYTGPSTPIVVMGR